MTLFGVSGVEFGRVGVGHAAHAAGVLDCRPLEPVADAEVGDAALARDPGSAHHASGSAIAEPAGHQDAVGAVEELFATGMLERFSLDPADVHAQPVLEPAVVERFVEALVGVLVADVLPDDVDRDLVGRVLDAVDQIVPGVHARFGLRQLQPVEEDAIEAFCGQDERHLVDAGDVFGGDHGFLVDVAEQRDLAA